MSRAARLLPLFFALLFTPAPSQQQKEKLPAAQLPPRLAANRREKLTEQKKETEGAQQQQQQPPTCPNITLRCPQRVVAGRPATFTAYLKRTGPAARREAYRWTVSAGNDRILKEQSAEGVHRIAVGTDGLGGKPVRATFTVAGYGPGCESRCETSVAPAPTPTQKETPTQRETPTQKETPAQKETPTEKETPTQKESPTTSPTPDTRRTPPPTPILPTNTNDNTGPAGTFTPTTSPPPGVSPSPAPSATPPGAVIASPSASPSTTVGEETTDAGLLRRFWPLLLLALLAASAALLFAKRATIADALRGRRDHKSAIDAPDTPGPPPDDPAKEGEMNQVLVGGMKREMDELQCSVYAPHECLPGDGFLVQAFAHLREHAPQLEALAKEADREASRRGANKLGMVERGQELLFHLDMPGLKVDDPTQPVVWSGEIESAQFGVTIPEGFRPRRINCKLTVSIKEFPIGHVRFVFEVVAAPRPADESAGKDEKDEEAGLGPGGAFVRYRKGFVSYASEDLPEVLARVQVMRLLGIEFFHALLSLKPGERWERALYKHIDDSDVFFLFWSAAANKSEWVEKEVRYALARKGADDERPPEILPVILEGPPDVPPPSYLDERHFNDPLALLIRAAAATRQRKKDA